jgi:hypothetical protein
MAIRCLVLSFYPALSCWHLELAAAEPNREPAHTSGVTQEVPGRASSLLSAREGFIQVEGGPVWYRIFGNGNATPLLLVHGGPGGRSCTFERRPHAAFKKPFPTRVLTFWRTAAT